MEERPMSGVPQDRPLSVLVVDDHRDAADSLGLLLRLYGHDVRVTYDGEHALALLADRPADVAVLDLLMPGLDGIALAERLAAEPGPRPLLLALSGSATAEASERAAVFDHCLLKPVDPDLLVDLLRRHARRLAGRTTLPGPEVTTIAGPRA
jgi:CheY-like chemotaxis protein